MSAWQGPPEGWACSGSGAMRSNNLSPLAALYVTPKSLPLVRVEGHNISQSCSGDEQVRGQLSHLAALRFDSFTGTQLCPRGRNCVPWDEMYNCVSWDTIVSSGTQFCPKRRNVTPASNYIILRLTMQKIQVSQLK